jgi:uncharacterized protein YkwD
MSRSARVGLVATLCIGLLHLVATSPAIGQAAVSSTHSRVFLPQVVTVATPAITPSSDESQALAAINQQRRAQGCASLEVNASLHQAARVHNEDMARNGIFSHTGSNGSSFAQRARDAGYTFTPTGETIAAGYSSAGAVVKGWMDSAPHREILMNCANQHIGLHLHADPGSQWRYYWTAVLGRR